jgi:ParB-like chromosome segregation protein Spo0J
VDEEAFYPELAPDFPFWTGLAPEVFEDLKASIAEYGVLVPVQVDEQTGELLDGHHRVRAWRELTEEGHTLPQIPVWEVDTSDPEWERLVWGP